MTELRDQVAEIIARMPLNLHCERVKAADAVIALIQKEQGWRDIESAPRDGTLMLLELDDGSIKLGRYHKSPTYSFLWWSEDAAPLSEPRRWQPTPTKGEGSPAAQEQGDG